MSRYSKAEAEARGWRFVHEKDEEIVHTAAGEQRIIPANIQAEKTVGTTLVTEQAETIGLLLERIARYEATQETLSTKETPTDIPSDVPLDEAGQHQRHVVVSDPDTGEPVTISDAEYSSRSVNEALYKDGEMIFLGPTDLAKEADAAVSHWARVAEDEAKAEPDTSKDGKQVEVDVSQSVIDTPGGKTGSVLVVRQDEDTDEQVSARREAESVEAENARVQADLDEVKGYSENVEPKSPDFAGIRSEAIEEEAKEQRDAGVESAEATQAAEDAGAEAEQKVVDEAAEESADTTTDATPAAEALAAEEGVDLSEVEGTGKDGKVTKPDVQALLDDGTLVE